VVVSQKLELMLAQNSSALNWVQQAGRICDKWIQFLQSLWLTTPKK